MHRPSRCVILVFLMLFLPVTVMAHPGRTDGRGGHTNHSTGEYHYHHGYSAHQHYDMDGDGKADCPYDFKDDTDHRSGSSNSATGKSSYITSPTTSATEPQMPSTVPIAPKTTTKKEEANPVPAWIYWCFGILLIVILVMYKIIRNKDWQMKEQERIFRSREEAQKRDMSKGLEAFHNALVEKYGDRYIYEISGAPKGDYLDKELLPHSSSAQKFGRDPYIYYFGGNPNWSNVKYHHRTCRFAKESYPVNAYQINKRRDVQRCALCYCILPNTDWVDKYKQLYAFLKSNGAISKEE